MIQSFAQRNTSGEVSQISSSVKTSGHMNTAVSCMIMSGLSISATSTLMFDAGDSNHFDALLVIYTVSAAIPKDLNDSE